MNYLAQHFIKEQIEFVKNTIAGSDDDDEYIKVDELRLVELKKVLKWLEDLEFKMNKLTERIVNYEQLKLGLCKECWGDEHE